MSHQMVEVTVYLRNDTKVTATVEVEYEAPEVGPDGIGTFGGGFGACIISTDAPFGLTVDEEKHIEEKAIEDFDLGDYE